jgi:hypothetical protein
MRDKIRFRGVLLGALFARVHFFGPEAIGLHLLVDLTLAERTSTKYRGHRASNFCSA